MGCWFTTINLATMMPSVCWHNTTKCLWLVCFLTIVIWVIKLIKFGFWKSFPYFGSFKALLIACMNVASGLSLLVWNHRHIFKSLCLKHINCAAKTGEHHNIFDSFLRILSFLRRTMMSQDRDNNALINDNTKGVVLGSHCLINNLTIYRRSADKAAMMLPFTLYYRSAKLIGYIYFDCVASLRTNLFLK